MIHNLSIATFIFGFLLLPYDVLQAQSNEGSPFDQSKFVPDIAFILDLSGVARDIQDQRYASLTLPGFSFPFLNKPSTTGLNVNRGMNFNYGELSLFSVVDPYFDLFAVLDLAPESAGLAEAYFSTRKLPYGFQLKGGKFLSGFGRINAQHEHFWDFANRPLIATALFGEDGLNETGFQVTWVAPASFFLMAGVEVLQGVNEQSFGTRGFNSPDGNIIVEPVQGPNLAVGIIRASFDMGDASILLGVSNAIGKARNDQGVSLGTGYAVDAATDIVGGDLTIKYSLDAIRFLSLQSEFMARVMNGSAYSAESGAADGIRLSTMKKQHSGFYIQAAARLDQRWEIGVRADLLMQNEVILDARPLTLPSNLPRYSAMVEFYPTEFSRFRLQVDRDLSRYLDTPEGLSFQPFTQIIVQANLTIGAHGAHAF